MHDDWAVELLGKIAKQAVRDFQTGYHQPGTMRAEKWLRLAGLLRDDGTFDMRGYGCKEVRVANTPQSTDRLVTFEYEGQKVSITYAPDRMSSDWEARYQQWDQRTLHPMDGQIYFLTTIITGWNISETEDSPPLPITRDVLTHTPMINAWFLGSIIGAVELDYDKMTEAMTQERKVVKSA